MGKIRIYEATEIESIRLHTFANIANEIYKSHGMSEYITVEDIYFDYGQNWWHTALVTNAPDEKWGNRWQTVCPRDYEIIISCDSVADLARYADYYVEARIDDEVCVDLSKIA